MRTSKIRKIRNKLKRFEKLDEFKAHRTDAMYTSDQDMKWCNSCCSNSGAPGAPRPAKRSIACLHTNRNLCNSFHMFNMASGMDRGRVHQTTTTSCSLGLIVQIWYWNSILWSIDCCQNKVSADQYHVTILLAQVLNSSRSHVFFKVDCWVTTVVLLLMWA